MTSALKSAADATGAGFDYLLRTARRESSLDPAAQAPTSSARGLFQFIEQTWLQTLKEDGPALGYAAEAADVAKTASGRYTVADSSRRAELLALRDDPTASALLAGALTQRNAATLSSKIGRAPTEGELYAAHFLGAQGAADLIALTRTQPNVSAASAFPSQASANRAIFYDGARARSASEVYARLTAGETRAVASAGVTLAAQETVDDQPPAYNAGREDDGRAFHSLFKTGRRSPVSSYVQQAWSALGPAGLSADAAQPLRAVRTASALTVDPVRTAPTSPAYAPASTERAAAFGGALAAPTATTPLVATAKKRPAAGTQVTAASASPLDLATFRKPNLKLPGTPR